MTSLPFAHPRRGTSALGAATVLVLAAAVGVGGALVTGGESPQAPAPAPAAQKTGLRLPMSFGSVSVDYVGRMIGSNRPMGLRVPRGHLPLQIGVTVVNVTDRPLRVPSDAFSLAAARGGMSFGSLRGGVVPPRTAHRIVLRYAVPERAMLPPLVVRDPAGGSRAALLGPTKGLTVVNVAAHSIGGNRP